MPRQLSPVAVVAPQLAVVVAAKTVQPAAMGMGSRRDGEEHDCEQPFHGHQLSAMPPVTELWPAVLPDGLEHHLAVGP